MRLATTLLLLAGAATPGARAGESGLDYFEKKVRPVLAAHCYKCHSQAARKHKGGLTLDSREGVRKGGDSGPAVVPGKPAASLLLQAVRYTADGPHMPPSGKLPEAVIANLETWIRMGAPDPRIAAATAPTETLDLEKGRRFWAFQAPRPQSPPAIKDRAWPRSAVDCFLLARLEAKGLRPVADADRSTLLRRAYFDLIGLPPTPEQIDRFLRDNSPDAFERVIDGLLASPHFGMRWGRHWLDVARFAESSGGGRSLLAPDAWRYRDYVIGSFNADRPYDRFIREQMAGDLLPAATLEQRRRQLVATAFLALGPTNYELQDKSVLEMDVVDEQLDTMGRAFLGLTLGCARCHDHKFDPIPTRDYYALAGILHSTQTLVHDNVSRWVERPLPVPEAREAVLRRHEAAVAELKKQMQQLRKTAPKAPRLKELTRQLAHLTATGPRRPMAMSVREAARIEDCHVCIRGNLHNRGPRVPRGFLQVVQVGSLPTIPATQSGRRQLAEWLAHPDNPLTARVLVNRVWHHLFGAGLVRTVDNFGRAGEPPSHPELLDYLARRFVRDGWSVKRLIRLLVLSRAYRMSSKSQPAALAVDPENRLLWRMNRRRLEAECIRDAMLAASGRLDQRLDGPTIKPGTSNEYTYRFNDTRRSVFTPVFRNKLPELFEVFDFADPNLVVGGRPVSTVATQALYLMNSPFVMDQVHHAARALLAVPGLDDVARIDRAYRLALGRLPTPRERQIALRFVRSGRPADWERLCQALFASLEFRYVD